MVFFQVENMHIVKEGIRETLGWRNQVNKAHTYIHNHMYVLILAIYRPKDVTCIHSITY